MRIEIPVRALSVNEAWAGRRFKSAKYKQFEKDIAKVLRHSKNTIKGEVEVHLTFYIKNYAMSDVDNLIKETLDQITKYGYIEDDRKIVFLSAEKRKSAEERIEVEIISYEG